jgi:ATP-dependent Clp protease ATP-binding subunit ClpC
MQFNYNGARARQARFRHLLERRGVIALFWFLAVFSIASWVYLLWLGQPLGNLLSVLTTATLMPVIWHKAYLKQLPVSANPKTIDQVLEPELLGLLKDNCTPDDLASVIEKTNGARFYGARFAISSQFLKNTIDTSSQTIEQIWQNAYDISKKYDEPYVSSASVYVALLSSIPENQYYLNQLGLDLKDVEAGLNWHNHIRKVVEKSGQKNGGSGIGRNLSFGYTPLLNRFGYNITESINRGGLLHREVGSRKDLYGQVSDILAKNGRRNVALVGGLGVGKTTFVYALANKILNSKGSARQLNNMQIIGLDSASLLANAKGRGQLEELMIRLFNEAARAKNIILFLDDAHLFFNSGSGSVDLTNIILPVLEGGAIRTILALDEQYWLELNQNKPGLAQMMNRITITPLNQEDTLSVVEDQVLLLEIKNDATYMYQALKEAHDLSDRYVKELAFPGRTIKLLESAVNFKEQKYFVTKKSVQTAVEKTLGVKVQTAQTSEDKQALLNLEGLIHERMINQTHAVSVVSDALRRARAGVGSSKKPIGTFLFLGPTGVGKTELSKSLAAVYFGGEDNLVRIDLNEFSGPNDAARLTANPTSNSNSLTALISKQPFSVVLLDEIEKAHPNVLNVLLQMLDEGVMRDSDNKEVSFRDSIIIATSNAGANEIRSRVEKGENLEDFEEEFINKLIDSKQFSPEFLNRFDEIVLFKPLGKEELLQVVELILSSLNKTLSAQKVSVSLTQAAKELLVDKGYDPRLGARPLRRVMQRTIESIVAKQILAGHVSPGAVINIDAPDLEGVSRLK